jgi:hypothetical protein
MKRQAIASHSTTLHVTNPVASLLNSDDRQHYALAEVKLKPVSSLNSGTAEALPDVILNTVQFILKSRHLRQLGCFRLEQLRTVIKK